MVISSRLVERIPLFPKLKSFLFRNHVYDEVHNSRTLAVELRENILNNMDHKNRKNVENLWKWWKLIKNSQTFLLKDISYYFKQIYYYNSMKHYSSHPTHPSYAYTIRLRSFCRLATLLSLKQFLHVVALTSSNTIIDY